jgi:hypothetical protein
MAELARVRERIRGRSEEIAAENTHLVKLNWVIGTSHASLVWIAAVRAPAQLAVTRAIAAAIAPPHT